MSHNITIEGGTSKRLLTAGKYCPEDIVVTAEGGTSVFATDALDGNIALLGGGIVCAVDEDRNAVMTGEALTATDDGMGNITLTRGE